MKFCLYLNMPSKKNSLMHTIIVEHDSSNLADFVKTLTDNLYVIVDEYYSDAYGPLMFRGPIAVLTELVGKVNVYDGSRSAVGSERPRLASAAPPEQMPERRR
jgi:hypothetical protein